MQIFLSLANYNNSLLILEIIYKYLLCLLVIRRYGYPQPSYLIAINLAIFLFFNNFSNHLSIIPLNLLPIFHAYCLFRAFAGN